MFVDFYSRMDCCELQVFFFNITILLFFINTTNEYTYCIFAVNQKVKNLINLAYIEIRKSIRYHVCGSSHTIVDNGVIQAKYIIPMTYRSEL